MKLHRLDLVHQYYVEEWPIERITIEAGCTPQTIRNRRAAYGLLDRDREWTPEDQIMAGVFIPKLTMGASLVGDMRTLASELQHRTSTLLKHCSGEWLRRYAPHVDAIPPGIGGLEIRRPTMRVQRITTSSETPKRQTSDSAGYDLHASEACVIQYGMQATIGTGLIIAVPAGWVGLICPRSGLAAKSAIGIQNGPGVLDSGYRGEVKVILHNTGALGKQEYKVDVGDRIGQLVVVPCFLGDVIEVDDLEETERGSGGFGSTGK
jgi:dUTP pyrophosphatase